MPDFSAVLGKKEGDISKPPVRPAGTYLMVVASPPELKGVTPKQGEHAGVECPVVGYKFRFIQAMDDVSQDQLESHKPVSEWGVFGKSKDFWLNTETGEYHHSQFLTHVLDQPESVGTVGERLAQTPGTQLLVKFKHVPYQDRTSGEQEIGLEFDGFAKP